MSGYQQYFFAKKKGLIVDNQTLVELCRYSIGRLAFCLGQIHLIKVDFNLDRCGRF